ncbi:ATP-binding protein [Actinotalea sp. AC32]|nr:ATP-binding protein [Actinotalea sp. AC32]
MTFRRGDLSSVRHWVRREARDVGLTEDRTDDMVLAVSELAANSVDHGGGSGSVRAWGEPGAFVVEVEDEGHIADPLAGLRTPGPDQLRGRGLWMVNQLADRVHLRSTPAGTTARVVAFV